MATVNVSSPLAPVLAAKYQAPVAWVESLIDEETELVAAGARVKTFVPIFVTRRVEDRLRRYAAEHREEAAAA
jgi:Protein of unknown function (DUF3562)